MKKKNSIRKFTVFNKKYLVDYLLIGIAVFITYFLLLNEISFGQYIIKGLSLAIASSALLFLLIIKRKFETPRLYTIVFFLFLVWGLLATLFSSYVGGSIWEYLGLVASFIYFLFLYGLFKSLNLKNKINFVLILNSVGSLITLYYLISESSRSNSVTGEHLLGPLYWHNQMAGYLLFLIPLSLISIFLIKRGIYKIFFVSFLIINLYAMLLTYSRGGWICLVLSSVFILFALKDFLKLKIKYILPIFIFLGVIVVIGFSGKIYNSSAVLVKDLTSNESTSTSGTRISVWKNSLRIIEDNPIIGVGPGQFGVVYNSYQDKPWIYSYNTHNQFLQITSEYGLVGFVLYFLLIFITVFQIFRNLNKQKSETKLIFVAFSTSFIGLILHSLVDYDLSTVSINLMLLMSIAYIISESNLLELRFDVAGSYKLIYVPVFILIMVASYFLYAERIYQEAKYYYLENNKSIDVVGLANQAILRNPTENRYQTLMANYLYYNKYSTASAHFFQVTRLNSSYSGEPYYNLAVIYLNNGDYANAERYSQKAINLNPYTSPRYYDVYADALYLQGKRHESIRVLDDAVRNKFPLNDSFWYLEYIYDATGLKVDLATLYIKLALRLREQDPSKNVRNLINTSIYLNKPRYNTDVPIIERI